MIKTYKANTNVSINIVLASKKNLHISFVPLSDGSSRFTTDCEEIQNAIESHYKYGRLFRLFGAQNAPEKKKSEKKTTVIPDEAGKTAAGTEAGTGTKTLQEKQNKVVKISDLAAAKDYLADTFGISRTSLRSKKAIVENAAANGIEFEGLD